MPRDALSPEQLRRCCPPASLGFETTAELQPLHEFFGQERARRALDFGVSIRESGFNLFVLGASGTGKQTLVRRYVSESAATEAPPVDWCYVNNFDQSRKPHAISLPTGQGRRFAHHVAEMISEASAGLFAVFESEEYRNRAELIQQHLTRRQEQVTEGLQEQARAKDLTLIRTPSGLTLVPVRDGKTMGRDDFQRLADAEREEIRTNIEALQEEMRKAFRQAPQWIRETRQKMTTLNEEMVRSAIAPLLAALRARYEELEEVTQYLSRLEQDLIDYFPVFLNEASDDDSSAPTVQVGEGEELSFTKRYAVNVLVDHGEAQGAPIVYVDHPTYQNLVGRIEHRAVQGTLVTDFTMIRPGALHRANGGYLVLDALKVLTEPFAWAALKRVLKSQQITIESLGETLGLVSTVGLEPAPIPLDVKIVLIGEPLIYYLLSTADPEFADLFKVQVDFDDEIERSAPNEQHYARMIATLARDAKLLPFDSTSVARIVDHGARLAGDSEKLTAHLRSIRDLLCESDFVARRRGGDRVTASDVQQSIDARIDRASRVRDRCQEAILRGTLLIDTDGETIGQVNALSVLQLGDFSFGRPSRVTAQARLGKGQVVDIEREVELGGPIHSKGVLILSHYLAAHYALDVPLSLSASLVFEQSYGGIDGDSASCAELCAVLSALARAPLRQSLAITGAVSQTGRVQAIGGVNDKIEGFFDVCHARGLTGTQGVVIPQANVKHLMLREDVVEAVRAGSFQIYSVENVLQALELLADRPAGERGDDGEFPPGTLNHRVESRLREFSANLRDFARPARTEEGTS